MKRFSLARAGKLLRTAAAALTLTLALGFTAFAEPLPDTMQSGPASAGWMQNSSGAWNYYYNGANQTGWQEIGSHWYLFDDAGVMLTGWQQRDGKDYYLAETTDATHPMGAMFASEKTPDGTVVNESGEKTSLMAIVGDRPNPYGVSCVEVSIPEQMMYCYLNNTLVLASPCVTGLPTSGRATATGRFSIYYKERDRYLQGYNSDGSKYKAWVNYWMPFYKGQGLHDASWRGSFGGNIYTYSGSHGCVNLPPDVAARLYEISWVGMPVFIH